MAECYKSYLIGQFIKTGIDIDTQRGCHYQLLVSYQ